MTNNVRTERRTVCGIVITLSATESTGFSPVGHIVNQIVDGLKEQNGKGKDDYETAMGDSRHNSLDLRVVGARIRDWSRARGGGILIPPRGI